MLTDTEGPLNTEKNTAELTKVADPKIIDYFSITHLDIDHYGAIKQLVDMAPNARLVGNVGDMHTGMLFKGHSPERCATVWPGQLLNHDGRSFSFDDSLVEDVFTFWLPGDKRRTCFSSDVFGAVQFGPPARYAHEFPTEAYVAGFNLCHQTNFTMLPALDAARFKEGVPQLAERRVKKIASAHRPVVRKGFGNVFEIMIRLPSSGLPRVPQLRPIFDLVRS